MFYMYKLGVRYVWENGKPRGEIHARNVSLETLRKFWKIYSVDNTKLCCYMELSLIQPLETTQLLEWTQIFRWGGDVI